LSIDIQSDILLWTRVIDIFSSFMDVNTYIRICRTTKKDNYMYHVQTIFQIIHTWESL